MPRIRDIAKACKSKNAGPFELTLDVVFDERSMYERVRATGVLGPELFARLYHVRPGGRAVLRVSGRQCVQGDDPAPRRFR